MSVRRLLSSASPSLRRPSAQLWPQSVRPVALTLEILFLGLSVVAELTESGNSPRRAVLICTMLGLMTAVGAIGSVLFLASISTTVMSAVLAFGAAALLYLVFRSSSSKRTRSASLCGWARCSSSASF
ncbi:MAG: hypothetical protein U0Q10_08350 [Dermatophilaceae bacterium]